MSFELPPLPYERTALEPYISAETLDFHHGKHHATYVNNLNGLIVGTEHEDAHLEEILCQATGAIFNNAAQVWNHTFYWHSMSPTGGGKPHGELDAAINKSFGSFEGFKEEFAKTALGTFGSGWAWLVKDSRGMLAMRSTSNADNPLCNGDTPLMTCDVWEHAYYLDHRNSRPAYLEAFWNVVNWTFVVGNYSRQS